MTYNSITKGIAHLFSFLDYLVYGLVSVVMDGLYNIAGTKIFADSSVTEIFDRLYVILGIFMLFKLAFSVLNGIINPDKFNDKQNGFVNIIKRVIITIVLLLMVPTIFNAAYHVQGNIIKALPQIILGPNQSYGDSSAGKEISETILSAFIRENEKCTSAQELNSVTLDNFIELATERCPNNDSNGKKIFMNTYSIVISSAVGIVLVVMLVLVSIDVGTRLIKMSLLQLVAPIPIMTYIDPKSEKDGAFGNWTKECIQTYISLFIQLGTIYLMIYLISSIAKDFATNPTGIITFPDGISSLAKVWVFIFIVIGGFFFMKEGPKFIMKILGIKGGTGLGIGLSAGLAGIGALTSGGGLAALAATGTALADGASAVADGKSAMGSGGLKKGREIAHNFKGIDKPVSIMQSMTDKLKSKEAAKYGVTQESLKNAKNAKNNANTTLEVAKSKLSEAIQNGKTVKWGDKTYSTDEFRNMIYGEDGFQAKANKANSAYDDMNSFGKKMGISSETYTEKYKASMKKGNNTYDLNPGDYKMPKSTNQSHTNSIPTVINARPEGPDDTLQMMANAQRMDKLERSKEKNIIGPDDTLQMMADAQNNNNNGKK